MCSHCLFPVVVTSLYGTSCYHPVTRLMTVTDLLQVVPARLIQAVRNKLLRACCHQLVNNLLRADGIHVKTHKLLQVCKQVVYKSVHMSTSCVRTACSQLL
jgi:hypothetical protein